MYMYIVIDGVHCDKCSLLAGEDHEFEVTAEMLIHEDVDDEQTMVEEEAMESKEEVEAEVANLDQGREGEGG